VATEIQQRQQGNGCRGTTKETSDERVAEAHSVTVQGWKSTPFIVYS
jgi:hypothetical protein